MKNQNVESLMRHKKLVSVRNWDEWFQLCGSMLPDLREYEALMHRYYFDVQFQKDEDSQRQAQALYQSKHNAGFYKQEKHIPVWLLTRVVKYVFVGLLLGVFGGLCFAFLKSISSGLGLSGYVASTHFVSIKSFLIIHAVVFGILSVILSGGIPLSLHELKVRQIFDKLSGLEYKLSDKIVYIPPKYRNSQAVNTFHDLYCSYGIVSFSQAIDACDEYLVSNNLVGAYMAVLFDVPYMNGLSAVERKKIADAQQAEEEKKSRDPMLPDDIESKVFEGVADADMQLDALIGLEQVKNQVRQMKNRMNFYGPGGQKDSYSGNHMVFLGPSGTGKTTVARIITRILYDFGYIRENKCLEIDGGYLKGLYAGQTAARANAIIQFAMGGVLLIDEAYILTEDTVSSQGAEAVGVLLKALEDHAKDFVCIFSGYEDDMNRMLSTNEGFSSRIKYKIYFENFTVEEMGAIFREFMRKSTSHRYKIEPKAYDLLLLHFNKERNVPGFGNARVVRNAWDSILDVHADRFMRKELSEDKKWVITEGDVQQYIDVRKKQMIEDGRNFIASRNLDSTVISLQELKQKTKSGSENPDEDLQSLTGLAVVKNEIKRLKAQFDFYDGRIENNGMHMVFIGPPGTGKTTVASIITGYLYQMGLIQENSYVDINGDFLRGMYLGHTGKRTEAVVQYAQGMVLFIDEAYLLSVSSDGSSDTFGQEAIGVLIDAMEKYRKNFIVIFAGYEKEMMDFLNMNSGLKSRLTLEFHFESYTPHELAMIFNNIAKKEGFVVNRDVWVPMQRYFKTKISELNFGNGRFVRQFFDDIKKQHIVNFADGMYIPEAKFLITIEDLNMLLDGTKIENDVHTEEVPM